MNHPDLSVFISETNDALRKLEHDLLLGEPSARRRQRVLLALHRFREVTEDAWRLAHELETCCDENQHCPTTFDEQPMSLSEWRERQKRELEQHRASVHERVDRMFDKIAERQQLDFLCIERDTEGLYQH